MRCSSSVVPLKVRIHDSGRVDVLSVHGVEVKNDVAVEGVDPKLLLEACRLFKKSLDGDLDPGAVFVFTLKAYACLMEIPGAEGWR